MKKLYKMKKIIFILLISFSTVYAQEDEHERIAALKTAFITEKLQLTSADAQKFWPIYNNFERRLHDLRLEKRSNVYRKLRNCWSEMTDDEANALIDNYLLLEFKELELQKEKTIALRKVISPKKIISLKIAEDDFKKELLDRYRHRKSEKKN